MRKNVLIIGAGGVAQVVAHKCAQNNDILGELHIASRTRAKCEAIIASVHEKRAPKVPGRFEAHTVDAMDTGAVSDLIRRTGAGIVINVGSSFVNMSVLDACIGTGAAYLDTAIHEDPAKVCETPPWYGNYEWKRRDAAEKAGVTAILGVGFDPGVVNAYARLAEEEYLDTIEGIDIVDINAGSHGRWFATNFDPEINFREFVSTAWSWEDNAWKANAMFEHRRDWELPAIGRHTTYLTGHDEIHSLSQNLAIAQIRFWMGFSDHYINVFTVLKRLGLLSEQPVRTARGQEVVPLEVVKAVLPVPASLAPDYTGLTCIGDLARGTRDGRSREVLIYNLCDHKACFEEVGSQAISYTAGVPAVAAAILIAQGVWDVRRMVNVEELDPLPFIALMNDIGLTTRIRDDHGDRILVPDENPAVAPRPRLLANAR